jgi:hypothetical protein
MDATYAVRGGATSSAAAVIRCATQAAAGDYSVWPQAQQQVAGKHGASITD